MDQHHPQRRYIYPARAFLLATSTSQLGRAQQNSNTCPCGLHWWHSVYWRVRAVYSWNRMGRISIVSPSQSVESDATKSVEICTCTGAIVSGGIHDHCIHCLGKFRSLSYDSRVGFQKQGFFAFTSYTHSQRISVLTLFITGVAGANFYSLLNFWPLEAQILYGPDPHRVARTIIPFGYAVASGVIFVNLGLSYFHGANRELLVISSAMMTAGVGALAAVNAGNQGLGIGMSVLGGFGVGGYFLFVCAG